MVAQYWQHVTSGEVYAIRVRDGHVVAANGPLHHGDTHADPADVADNGIDADLADDIDGAQDDYRPMDMDLVGMSEIAQRLGTSAGLVRQWRQRAIGFPQPLVTLATGPVWDWSTVQAWAAVPRPPGPRPKGRT